MEVLWKASFGSAAKKPTVGRNILQAMINNKIDLPLTVGISGASGNIYGLRLLQFLLENNYKINLVVSESALKVALHENNLLLSSNPQTQKEQVLSYLSLSLSNDDLLTVWPHDDIAASISSGSYKTSGMVIIPASMGTVASIACGISRNLITRAADVCLKEKRKLILVPREMPVSSIHLENMLKLSNLGVIIAPACPGFYHNPVQTFDLIDFVVGKVLDLLGFEHNIFKRWQSQSKQLTSKTSTNL